jgi:quinol-cytochrome oxidoreductase complex cytochrome b subunit
MAVDYREQYRPDKLEPFFPNEIVKMLIVVLCTLAVLMFLVVLPILIESFGIEGVFHEEQPADSSVTPEHILPEWYFLAVYQFLKLMPAEILGMDGKALGIFTQIIVISMVLLIPFWFPLRTASLKSSDWLRGLGTFGLMWALVILPAAVLFWVRSSMSESYRDILHPMFVWSILAIASYVIAGRLARRMGFTDAFGWLKLLTVGTLLIGFQFLAFFVILAQGLSWAIPKAQAYTLGGIPLVVATAAILWFLFRRVQGRDQTHRVWLLAGFVTESIALFIGLTIWAMWPAGGLYSKEHGWSHGAGGFLFSVAIIAVAVIVFYAFLATERRTIKNTLSPEERDQLP